MRQNTLIIVIGIAVSQAPLGCAKRNEAPSNTIARQSDLACYEAQRLPAGGAIVAIGEDGRVLIETPGALTIFDGTTFKPLAVPAGYASISGRAMNNHGQVVGFAESFAGELRAFAWYDGIPTAIAVPDSMGVDINDSGHAVGVTGASGISVADRRGFLFRDGVTTYFDLVGPSEGGSSGRGGVYGISTDDRVVACYYFFLDSKGCFIWSEDGVVDLVTATGRPFVPYQVNRAAHVLGSEPVRLWRDGVRTEIRAPDGAFVQSLDLTDNDMVLGLGTAPFLWRNGVSSPVSLPEARAVNERGRVIGAAGPRSPLVWENGVARSLPVPDDLAVATAGFINNAGMIAGTGSTETGEDRQPIPLLWRPTGCGGSDAGPSADAGPPGNDDSGPPEPPPEEPFE